jgi:hypothetical protein
MKKLLAIIVLGLLLNGCSENILGDDKLVVLNCINKNGAEFQLIIDLDKNTMQFWDWNPYTITSISDTKIIANNLDKLSSEGALRHILTFKRYGGEFVFRMVYADGKPRLTSKYVCKESKKVF